MNTMVSSGAAGCSRLIGVNDAAQHGHEGLPVASVVFEVSDVI